MSEPAPTPEEAAPEGGFRARHALLKRLADVVSLPTSRINAFERSVTGDLLVGRPLLLTATVLGTAIWLVALPFSALGGNVKDSAEALIGWPARNTFERCLGCPTAGYKKD